MKKQKFDKIKLVGRDPTLGFLSFKTGVIKTLKDKLRNRNSKASRAERRKELDN